jgi:hypothetical protein
MAEANIPTTVDAAELLFEALWQRAMQNDITQNDAAALRVASVALARALHPDAHLFDDWSAR